MTVEKNILVEKWDALLTTDKGVSPITEKTQKAVMAQLLENQQKWLTEDVSSAGDIGMFTPILIPTVRRIFPNLVANQIVGVQPMSGPTGYAYAWRTSYAGDKDNSASAAVNPIHRGESSSSITGPQFRSVVLVHSSFTIAGAVAAGDTVRSASSGGGNLHGTVKYVENTDGLVKVLVEYAMTGSVIDFPIVVDPSAPVYYSSSNTTARVVVSMFNNESGYNLIFRNYAGPVSTATGETLGSAGNRMKQMRAHMERTTVTAESRKLRAEYTLEMAQDLKAMHGIDAEAELMNVMQYEIAAEIDRDLVASINNNATATTAWVYGQVGAQANTAGYADGQWELEKFRTLYTRILKESNRIAVTTRRGPGNFIICSPNVVAALEGLNNFLYSAVPNDVGPISGVTKVGTLDGRFAVYVDTFSDLSSTGDYITVGYKGPTAMDSGVIYCPYIPLMMQKVILEDTLQPAMGVLTRSAIAYNMQGTQNFYRQIPVTLTGSQLA